MLLLTRFQSGSLCLQGCLGAACAAATTSGASWGAEGPACCCSNAAPVLARPALLLQHECIHLSVVCGNCNNDSASDVRQLGILNNVAMYKISFTALCTQVSRLLLREVSTHLTLTLGLRPRQAPLPEVYHAAVHLHQCCHHMLAAVQLLSTRISAAPTFLLQRRCCRPASVLPPHACCSAAAVNLHQCCPHMLAAAPLLSTCISAAPTCLLQRR